MYYFRYMWYHKGRKWSQGFLEVGRGRNEELVFSRYRVFVWEDEKALEMDSGDGCTIL